MSQVSLYRKHIISMSSLLLEKIPLVICKTIEAFLVKYDPKKHDWLSLSSKGSLCGIKWLHCNRIEGCKSDAMNFAAENGHLEVVRFLQ